MQRYVTKKKCSPSLRNDPRNYLSESNPPLLMNKEDQMASSISQKVRVMQHASIMRNHFMFWDGIRSERICLSATINKLNYFKFESACDCINNLSTWYSVSQIARLPY